MTELTQYQAQIIINALHCLLQRDGLNAPAGVEAIALHFATLLEQAKAAEEADSDVNAATVSDASSVDTITE
tara:strand:+ start:891 stop:1106 length:216 start_codon:yes stop_codon:yes gene_type:complete